MEVDKSANIDTDAFLPPVGRQQSKQQAKAGKKRTNSTSAGADEQMQVDETTGIEGARKTQAPKAKRKKPANVEIRKVPVPSHRFVPENSIILSILLLITRLIFICLILDILH